MSSPEGVTPKLDFNDVEKNASTSSVAAADVLNGSTRSLSEKKSVWAQLSQHGVEVRGAAPVAPEDRTDLRFFNVFTVFSTSMLSLLP